MSFDETRQRVSKQDRADPKLLFMQQVTRCLQTVGSDYFGPNVEGLLRMLPTASYLLLVDQSDEWNYDTQVLVYKKSVGGIKRGFEDDPIVWNSTHTLTGRSREYGVQRLEDGSIDWSDPNIVSPTLEIQTKRDYDQLFRMILTEAQDCGIWWTDVAGGILNLPGTIGDVLKVSKNTPRTPR